MDKKQNNRGFSSTLVVIIFFLVLAGAAAYLWDKKVPTGTGPLIPPVDSMADWQTYRNDEWGFEFKYPAAANINVAQPQFGVPLSFEAVISSSQGTIVSLSTFEPGRVIDLSENTNRCDEFNFYTRTVDGRTVEIRESNSCLSGDLGDISGRKITSDNPLFFAVVPLRDGAELGIDSSNASVAREILSTFKFTK